MDRYVVYIRKSTDTEDRQILSLESQKRVITEELVVPQNISPFTWYEESKSAKAPGRPKFDEMIENINKGKVTHIICWQLNRLARNSVDGGRLIWFVQNDTVKIVTPTKTYDKNDILLLYVEFAMANQFSNDLSKSVLRGLEDKVRKGIAPILAPIGYCNDMTKPKGLKDILPDEKRFQMVRQMWDLLLTSKMTPALINKIATKQWGLKHRNGNLISRTQTYDLFHNIFYTGQFYYQKEIHQGIHKPMITLAEFEEAQKILQLRGKKGNCQQEATYRGMMKCPCSASITAQVKPRMICPACHKKFNPQHNESCPQCKLNKNKMEVPIRIYTYYRCSRQIDEDCRQTPITEKDLEKQVSNELMNITLPDDFIEWGKKYIKTAAKNQCNQSLTIEETLKREFTLDKEMLQNLLNKYISPDNKNGEIISGQDYKHKKLELQTNISLLEGKIKTLNENVTFSWDNTEKTLIFSKRARYWFENGSREQKRIIFSTLDQEPVFDMGLLHLNLLKPFEYIKETKKETEEIKHKFEPKEWEEAMIQKYYLRLENPLVSGGGDLNP